MAHTLRQDSTSFAEKTGDETKPTWVENTGYSSGKHQSGSYMSKVVYTPKDREEVQDELEKIQEGKSR